MEIRPIRTEADYKTALKEISALMECDPELGIPDGDRLDVLATLVHAYEARHFPVECLITINAPAINAPD
jgi:HTH-type transcriptional regulator / antitoxin HigA